MTNELYMIECEKHGLIPLDNFINRKTSLRHKCLICGKEFTLTPRAVLVKTGYGCRSCNQKDTLESFRNKLNSVNPNIRIIGNYINSKTKIKCECILDGCQWESRPNDLLQGIGCPRCSNYEKISNEQFINQFHECGNNNIELLSDFVNHRTPILCKCKTDNYEWSAYPYDLLHNRSGCRKCAGNASYTTGSFISEMKNINNNIEIIGDYVDNKTPIQCRCKICNTIWNAAPGNLKNSHTGCPSCSGYSKLEELTKLYLDNNHINYIIQKSYDGLVGVGGKPLTYDFYLPDYSLLIECQGKQHEEPITYFGGEEKFKTQQEHDKRKNEYAKLHKIKLLEIWYYDINKIDQILNQILKSKEEYAS